MAKKDHHTPSESNGRIRIKPSGEGGAGKIRIKPKPNPTIAEKEVKPPVISFWVRNKKYLWIGGGALAGVLLLLMVFIAANHNNTNENQEEANTDVNIQSSVTGNNDILRSDSYIIQDDTFNVLENAPYHGKKEMQALLFEYRVSPERQNQINQLLDMQGDHQGAIRYLLLSHPGSKQAARFVLEPEENIQTIVNLEKANSFPIVLERKLHFETRVLYGLIDQDIWDPLLNYPNGYRLLNEMEEILLSKVNFYRVQPGDQYKIIYRVKLLDDRVKEVMGIQAIQFIPQEGEEVLAFHFPQRGRKAFFDQEGRSLEQSFWRTPVKFAQVSSDFGVRYHPTEKEEIFHEGVDFAAKEGTPIYAVADGEVLLATKNALNGNYVKLQHGEDYITFYLHMSRFAEGIRKGASVSQGQVIGYVGNTGRSTGPHVCFHLRYKGKPIDSQTADLPEPEPLPTADLALFMAQRDNLLSQLEGVRKLMLP